MALSRRKLIRNLGSLTAAQSIPAAAASFLLGCDSKPAPAPVQTPAAPAASSAAAVSAPRTTPDPNAIYVLFEGPWLFSPIATDNTQMMATAVLDSGHVCAAGKWGGAGMLKPAAPTAGAQWTGTLGDASAPKFKFKDVVGGAFSQGSKPAVYLTGLTVKPQLASDITVTLPVPNAVLLGGRLNNGAVQGSWGGNNPNAMPYVATILKYLPNGSTPLTLNLGPASAPVALSPNDHFILRVNHPGCLTPTEDVAHVVAAFQTIQKRIGDCKPRLTLALNTTDYDPSTGVDGISEMEMGVGHSACAGTPQTAGPHKPTPVPNDGVFANCAGGGGAVDCC